MRTLVDEFPQSKTFFQVVGFGLNDSAIAKMIRHYEQIGLPTEAERSETVWLS